MFVLMATILTTQPSMGPAPESNPQLLAPIKTWDEALPLGNGLMGALLWGEGNNINLSLDRGDIWDLREQGLTASPPWNYQHLQELIKAKDQEEISHLFDSPYDQPRPTKLPGIRLELKLDSRYSAKIFELKLASGVARFSGDHGDGYFCVRRDNPVAVGRLSVPIESAHLQTSAALEKLDYKPFFFGHDVTGSWVVQVAAKGLTYAAFVATKTVKDTTEIAVSFTTNAHNKDALKEARRIAVQALKWGYANAEEENANWWKSFWDVSSVRVPNQKIQAQYDFAMYLYGAGAAKGAPPIPLQGLWTADDGNLPPWKGDYHHDLNTELTYWPYLTSGHWEQGEGLLDFLAKQLPRYQLFAQEFYAQKGASIPGVASLDGSPLGGWAQYSLSPTTGLWLAEAFVDQWRYSGNQFFLRKEAYPFCRELALCVQGLLRTDKDGILKLPLSSSPEIHDNTLEAWLKPNSNFDLGILKKFYSDLSEMAMALHNPTDEKEWKDISKNLEGFHISKVDGGLTVDSAEELAESHRHFSHIIAIHPLGLITVEGSDEDKKIIEASLARLAKLGTKFWCGYSFAWMACIQARTGHADEALKNLSIYANAFVLRNGFHANGDQSGKGYSDFNYRPVTLEGNFAAAQAVNEMILQSWGGKVRVFPAVPVAWGDVSFTDLRAEGGFIVSAKRMNGKTVEVTVTATIPGILRLRVPESMSWITPEGTKSGSTLEVPMKPGQQATGK